MLADGTINAIGGEKSSRATARKNDDLLRPTVPVMGVRLASVLQCRTYSSLGVKMDVQQGYCCYCYCYWGLKVHGSDLTPIVMCYKDFSCRNPTYPWTIKTERCSKILSCKSKLQIGLIWGFSVIQTNKFLRNTLQEVK
jgi:hypothetical protein